MASRQRYNQWLTPEIRKAKRNVFNPKLFQEYQSQGAYKRNNESIGCRCSEYVILGGSRRYTYQQHLKSDTHQKWQNPVATATIQHILQPQQPNM